MIFGPTKVSAATWRTDRDRHQARHYLHTDENRGWQTLAFLSCGSLSGDATSPLTSPLVWLCSAMVNINSSPLLSFLSFLPSNQFPPCSLPLSIVDHEADSLLLLLVSGCNWHCCSCSVYSYLCHHRKLLSYHGRRCESQRRCTGGN